LLAGPLVGPKRLREIQLRWQDETNETVRRALAHEYEKLVAGNGSVDAAEIRAKPQGAGGQELALPVARFFPARFAHVKGPAAGQPFTLEPWQRRFVTEFSRATGGGERIYKRGLLGVARGNGKSPLAAGLALRELAASTTSPTSSSLLAIRLASYSNTHAASSSQGRFLTSSRWDGTRSATRQTAASCGLCPQTASSRMASSHRR
jgi:hypothetical protein